MQRPILVYPDPFLATRAVPVARVDGSIRELVRDMFETLQAAQGIGLAATQIGVGKRVIVVDISPVDRDCAPFALINPEIVERDGRVEGTEGCLSVPGVEGLVIRAERVVVTGIDAEGRNVRVEAHALLARVLQHEIDHLNGILFIERLPAAAVNSR